MKPRVPEDKDLPTTLGAEKMTGRPDREVILQKNAEIIRGQTTLNADSATYDIIEDEAEAKGNVRMNRAGDIYTGDEMKLRLDTGQGYVTNPTYRLQRNNAQGKAERIDFESQERAVIIDGTYSTCEGPNPDWYLQSSKLNLDAGRDIGTGSNTVIYFKGVPILGTPYMSFPLSGARKSGVLPPTLVTSNKGGLEILLPYYFNIAPNRDLTVYPRFISQRGLQLGAQGRYLGETYGGETRVEGLLDDRLTGSNRYAISSVHRQSLGSGFTFNSNINAASDDNYPNDFPSTITAASQRLLLRDMSLGYAGTHWSASARASNYQVLQDPLAPITRPYDRLPQLNLLAGRQDVNGFDWSANSEMTRFWHPDLVRGDRLVVNPRISYPIIRPGYFLTPSVSVHGSTYRLSQQPTGTPSSFTRVLPTASVDGGLIFEREASFLGKEARQTLEPRLFYVYTPYRNQSQIPLFDTALTDFNFTQLFSENRFSGHDRISDANQLTAAVTTRFIEPSGAERMRFALAQRYYFDDQRVVSTATSTVAERRSDVLLAASGQITSTVAVNSDVQYSQSLRGVSRSTYGVSWHPAPKKVLNLQYRRDDAAALKLVDVSGQWPIASRWYAVGRVNYSLQDKKVSEGLLGLEYQADCWVFRAVAQRIPTGTGVATSRLFLQLELNGLSKIGSNPLEALKTSVPGYEIINKP
ncbi:MAG: LPS-assembly protein LptD [Pseudomonadota bacterium]